MASKETATPIDVDDLDIQHFRNAQRSKSSGNKVATDMLGTASLEFNNGHNGHKSTEALYNKLSKIVQGRKTQTWRVEAECHGLPTEAFFPDDASEPPDFVYQACGSCAVRKECLDYAQSGKERHGIWGGVRIKGR